MKEMYFLEKCRKITAVFIHLIYGKRLFTSYQMLKLLNTVPKPVMTFSAKDVKFCTHENVFTLNACFRISTLCLVGLCKQFCPRRGPSKHRTSAEIQRV